MNHVTGREFPDSRITLNNQEPMVSESHCGPNNCLRGQFNTDLLANGREPLEKLALNLEMPCIVVELCLPLAKLREKGL